MLHDKATSGSEIKHPFLDASNARSAEAVKFSLMFRASTEGRLDEMIQIIDELEERVRDATFGVSEIIGTFDVENYGQPQAIRALNLLAQRYGTGQRYTYDSGTPIKRPPGAYPHLDG